MSGKDVKKTKLSTNVDSNFGSSPFSSLNLIGLGNNSGNVKRVKTNLYEGNSFKEGMKIGHGRRLEIRREKSGRGGKTVTTVKGFPQEIDSELKNQILKKIKSSLGTGGTWVGSTMELQGDRRKEVFDWMLTLEFKPVNAGG
ncbi:MAG: translation initiation factor [Opitutae bacterium]|nr:translation initiation factor [Opitutae bacterium]